MQRLDHASLHLARGGLLAGRSTTVEVTFVAVGDETRVSVEHSGWETIPEEHVARHRFPLHHFLQREAEWWQVLLASLRAAVDKP